MLNENLINLSDAAILIETISGYPLKRNNLQMKILRGSWPHSTTKLGRDWHLKESEVRKYAKTYKPSNAGRPIVLKNKLK